MQLSERLDQHIVDHLVVATLPAAAGMLGRDFDHLPSVLEWRLRSALRVWISYTGQLRPLAASRLFSSVAVDLGEPAQCDLAINRSLDRGLLGVLPAPVRFRVAAMPGRWQLRDELTQRYGWINDPANWQINLVLLDGVLLAEVGPLHWQRRHSSLARLPASTTPVLAAYIARRARLGSGAVVCDPCCGAGTLIVEALAISRGLHLIATDIEGTAVEAARTNLPTSVLVAQADAARIPVREQTLDRVIVNLPWGKRSGTTSLNTELYPRFAREIDRALAPDGIALVLTEDKRRWERAVTDAGTRLSIVSGQVIDLAGSHPTLYAVRRARSRKKGKQETS